MKNTDIFIEKTTIEDKTFIFKYIINSSEKDGIYGYVKLKSEETLRRIVNPVIDQLELTEEEKELIIKTPTRYKFKIVEKSNDGKKSSRKNRELFAIIEKNDIMDKLITFICKQYKNLEDLDILSKSSQDNKLKVCVNNKNIYTIEELENNYMIELNDLVAFSFGYSRIFDPSKNKISKTISSNTYSSIFLNKKDFKDFNSRLLNDIFGDKDEISIDKFIELLLKDISKYINENIEIQDSISKDNELNFLLKGVPGTGKSRCIDINLDRLNIKKQNRRRINIHSQSSNTDLIQGIGIQLTKKENIKYTEKDGIILNFILEAIKNPNDKYALILEEIQENSLNELIGDLVYLIDKEKRVKYEDVQIYKNKYKVANKDNNIENVFEFINYIVENKDVDYITIPNLAEENKSNSFRRLLLPSNLYIFCTTNYRDDKKILEDNLFRRFEVIDMFPNSKAIRNLYIKEFFQIINESIEVNYVDEINVDRYLIGQANWIKVNTIEDFYKAFIKLINEFKEIRDVEFDEFKAIFTSESMINKYKVKDERWLNESEEINTKEINRNKINNIIKEIINTLSDENMNYYRLLKCIMSKLEYSFLEE